MVNQRVRTLVRVSGIVQGRASGPSVYSLAGGLELGDLVPPARPRSGSRSEWLPFTSKRERTIPGRVALSGRVPCNDGGISLGQAVAAAARTAPNNSYGPRTLI